MRPPLFLLAPALMMAGGSAAFAQAVPVPVPVVDGTLLDITAEGHVTRVPDVATIRAGVVTQGQTASAALSDNAARMVRVLAALKKAGVVARDVRTATVSLSPQYRYTDGQAPALTGYQASNSVAVRFRDITRTGTILDALVAEGANQIDGPSLSIDQPDAALDEARSSAVRVAQARAALYAKAAGLSVARIVSIAEGGVNDGASPQPPMLYARAAKVNEATQIAAGESDVSVTLSVRFLLK